MMQFGMQGRGVRFAAVIAGTLLLAACAQTKPDGLTGNVQPGTGQDFVVNVGDRVFFGNDQTTLSSQATATLDKQVRWLQSYGRYTVTIEGHADERGTREYNLALGARRANAVRDFLISQGVNASRVQTISFGKERPVSLCSEESCWSKNRRSVSTLR